MDLNGLKWLFLAIIFSISMASGLSTLHIANRYRKLVGFGEALANGIFLGAAVFHMIPDAADNFSRLHHFSPYFYTCLLAVISFAVLTIIDSQIVPHITNHKHISRVGPLLITLSIHAFITGIALGISNSYVVVVSLLIAILAHKAFEMFALVINLHRQIKHKKHIRLLFFLFSFVTPIGILIGSSGDAFLPLATGNAMTAYLNSICAGTFLYIATIHSRHSHHPFDDSYQRYSQALMTLLGVMLMGILAIWI